MIPRHDIPDWVARHPDVDPPQPRALVALSEDRQWLAWLDEEGDWNICKRDSQYSFDYERSVTDTGQDAHEVLAQFLKERGG